MIKEYEIDYSKKAPKLNLINKYNFKENMTDYQIWLKVSDQ